MSTGGPMRVERGRSSAFSSPGRQQLRRCGSSFDTSGAPGGRKDKRAIDRHFLTLTKFDAYSQLSLLTTKSARKADSVEEAEEHKSNATSSEAEQQEEEEEN
ncbi:hypothetical protein T10_6428 [Trichinella papuae]|uniref:Uncharacterized protein n=1 Tax=Trichinella papuae TaxID=268474 RepID=A0A0V1ML42_9BILA|nr:hypothetical protein T10_6428 [Trichinella papuae]